MTSAFLSGVFMMGLATSALVFLRLWRESGEDLFFAFSLAFWLMALERVPLALFEKMKEPESFVYLLRLAGFLIILEGIRRKNALVRRPRRKPRPGKTSA